MRRLIAAILFIFCLACNKVIEVELPPYSPQIVVEMYLEVGKPMRCLVAESIPYTDTGINRPLNNATVVVSDGVHFDTLKNQLSEDKETARWYNFYHPRIISNDTTKVYTLQVWDKSNRVVTATTRFSQAIVPIDTLTSKPSETEPDSLSVGVKITDPASIENFYRFLVVKKINDLGADPTDFALPDVSFNGKAFSFYTEGQYAKNDTVTVRVYSMQKEHYDFYESADDARDSNFNPFSQPAGIKSNVTGGIGIFTAIRYAERRLILK